MWLRAAVFAATCSDTAFSACGLAFYRVSCYLVRTFSIRYSILSCSLAFYHDRLRIDSCGDEHVLPGCVDCVAVLSCATDRLYATLFRGVVVDCAVDLAPDTVRQAAARALQQSLGRDDLTFGCSRTYSFRAYSIRSRATVPAVARSGVTLDGANLVGIRLCAAVSAATRADAALEVASVFHQTLFVYAQLFRAYCSLSRIVRPAHDRFERWRARAARMR
eukprot:COSAG02_NODE_4966_length_4774_cov_7.241925_5_plen_220_part_00